VKVCIIYQTEKEDKISPASQTVASVRIAPKICQGVRYCGQGRGPAYSAMNSRKKGAWVCLPLPQLSDVST